LTAPAAPVTVAVGLIGQGFGVGQRMPWWCADFNELGQQAHPRDCYFEGQVFEAWKWFLV
jgi:hypothetical protein